MEPGLILAAVAAASLQHQQPVAGQAKALPNGAVGAEKSLAAVAAAADTAGDFGEQLQHPDINQTSK